MRSRMCDVKTNYKSHYRHNMMCRLCGKSEESESHLLSCEEMLIDNDDNVTVDDIWNRNKTQTVAVKIFSKLFKIRNNKFKSKNLSFGTQANPPTWSSSYTVQCMILD